MIKIILAILFLSLPSLSSDNDAIPLGNKFTSYKGFCLDYDTIHKNPIWVAYELTPKELSVNVAKRADNFRVDHHFNTATNNDYKKSGYDKGHMAPAADMAFNNIAMNLSFLFSNITPQLPQLNRDSWLKLETFIRDKTSKSNCPTLIVTGPLGYTNKFIGDSVFIPKSFFKAIYNNGYSAAFIMFNKSNNPPLDKLMITVDSLEILTGLDFPFDSISESKLNKEYWF